MILGGILMIVFHILQISGKDVQDITEGSGEIGIENTFYQFDQLFDNAMEEIKKPESYERMEKNDPALALFRQSPCKDWAPLPTPQTTFASSFFGGENQEDAVEGGKGKGRKSSWGPRGSRRGSAESADNYDESEWAEGDTSLDFAGSIK